MSTVMVDGVPQEHVPADDRGLLYGDGVFETLRVQAGVPLRLDRHLARLAAGARRLGIDPPDQATLEREALALSRDRGEGILKVLVTRGSGGRGYHPGAHAVTRRVLSLHPLPVWPPHWPAEGVAVRWCRTRVALQDALAGIKHLCRLEQVLARAEWSDLDTWQEGLMRDTEGHVIEATQANLFIVNDGVLQTPAVDHAGVAGIMRDMLLEAAAALDLPSRVTTLTVAQVTAADELLLCNSLIGIWPVRRLAETQYAAPGPVTRRLCAWLDENPG